MTRKRIAAAVIGAVSLLYALAAASGLVDLRDGAGGLVYRLVVIGVLAWCCLRLLATRNRSGALISALLAFALCALADLSSLFYVWQLDGSRQDLTLNSWDRSCAYLLFAVAALSLLPPGTGTRWVARALRAMLIVATALTLGAVLVGSARQVYVTAFALALLCLLAALLLLVASASATGEARRAGRRVAIAVVAFCLLDTGNRILSLAAPFSWPHAFLLAWYPMAYLALAWALWKVPQERRSRG